MNLLELAQPFAQLCVTRQPHCPICDGGAGPGVFCEGPHPMVKRMIVRPDPCPAELVGQRIALAANNEKPWRLRMICCGRDDGHHDYATWEQADAERSAYVAAEYHERSAIIEGPFGVIVGSATIQTSLPIVEHTGDHDDELYSCLGQPETLYRQQVVGDPFIRSNVITTDVSDQLAYDTFTPGHHAWLLDDAAPTTERCPWCWGEEFIENPNYCCPEDEPPSIDCPICDSTGHCEPIPWTSPDGTGPHEWNPT